MRVKAKSRAPTQFIYRFANTRIKLQAIIEGKHSAKLSSFFLHTLTVRSRHFYRNFEYSHYCDYATTVFMFSEPVISLISRYKKL